MTAELVQKRKDIELSLSMEKEARGSADRALKLREEFISVASHELRTPLTALKLQIDLIKRRTAKNVPLSSEAITQVLERCERQIARLSALVEDMLDISRISSGRLSLRLEQVNLKELLNDVVEHYSESLKGAGIEFSVSIEDEIVGYWDAYRIEQVVANLLGNALKYGNAGKIGLRARLETSKSGVLIEVQDQGIGIANKDLPKVFECFERAVPSKNISGLGLGLYISRQIVEAHGGRIEVLSQVGVGSTFQVYLPQNDLRGPTTISHSDTLD